jgi:hypothetical protein
MQRQIEKSDLVDPESLEAAQRYLHWDELRRRPLEKGLSLLDEWAIVKAARASRYQRIPLTDKSGRACVFFVNAKMFETLHRIDQGGGGMLAASEAEGAVANTHTRDQYYMSSLIEESITSSQLEGAVTTRVVAREMLRSGRSPRDRSERMILNNFRTMHQLREWKDRDLSPELILEIHRMISDNALDVADGAGRWRRDAEAVRVENMEGETFHTPPPASELPGRIEKMCSFANERAIRGYLHPVLRSIILHYWLAYDHPFVDGNGPHGPRPVLLVHAQAPLLAGGVYFDLQHPAEIAGGLLPGLPLYTDRRERSELLSVASTGRGDEGHRVPARLDSPQDSRPCQGEAGDGCLAAVQRPSGGSVATRLSKTIHRIHRHRPHEQSRCQQ